MKALVAVIGCVLLSACSAAALPPTLGGLDTASPERPPFSADPAAEAATEKSGPSTCTIKSEIVSCF